VENNDKKVMLGRISTVYGVKGWLKVNSHTDPRKNIFNYTQWQLKTGKNWRNWKVEQGRPHGKTLVVKLEGCNDRDQAKLLVGSTIAVSRDQLPEINSDEHYWSDILGMQVVTHDGKALGQVKDILETGSNDVLVVKSRSSGKTVECLIPWLVGDVIVNVDEHLITVNWEPDY